MRNVKFYGEQTRVKTNGSNSLLIIILISISPRELLAVSIKVQ